LKTFVQVALIVFVVLILIPGGLLKLYFARADARTEQFYQARAILQAMRSVQPNAANPSDTARDAFLQHVPLGTAAGAAVAALSKEGFACHLERPPQNAAEKKLAEVAEQRRHIVGLPRKSGKRMDCLLGTPLAIGYTTWMVELDFDDADRLTNAMVGTWNIFL
jgi:hypothetical protein